MSKQFDERDRNYCVLRGKRFPRFSNDDEKNFVSLVRHIMTVVHFKMIPGVCLLRKTNVEIVLRS